MKRRTQEWGERQKGFSVTKEGKRRGETKRTVKSEIYRLQGEVK